MKTTNNALEKDTQVFIFFLVPVSHKSIYLFIYLFYPRWRCPFQSKLANSFGWTHLLSRWDSQKMNKGCQLLWFLFNKCIMQLSSRICICQKYFPHEQNSQSPTIATTCGSLSITSSPSHIFREEHTRTYSDTKRDRSSVTWEIITQLALSMHLMAAFKPRCITQHVGTEAGMLTSIFDSQKLCHNRSYYRR